MTRTDPTSQEDAWLADFTDSILDGEAGSPPESAPNAEALALAESLLRLKRAFPKQELDAASIKRMRSEIMEKLREEKRKKPRWTDIFRLDLGSARRQQAGLAFAMLILAGMVILSAPFLFSNGGSLTAAAGMNIPGAAIGLGLVVLAVVLYLLLRRKS